VAAPAVDRPLLAGIAAYRRHPWQREPTRLPVIWSEGGSTIIDYSNPGLAADRSPTLFVPSLVNRAHVLDLLPGHSMLRFLAGRGLRTLLLDWGWPGEIERSFTLTDYVAGRLERAITSLGRPVTLAGYCMGGLMAAAAAQRRPDLVERLVLLATPWDFFAAGEASSRRLAGLLPAFEPGFALTGTLPVDALQILFSMADPHAVATRYRDFGRQDQASSRAARFVALEDWLNDGVPLAAGVAREILSGWHGANTPAQGRWRIAGAAIEPRSLVQPSFVALPARDRIVPPQSARPLAEAIAGAKIVLPQAGHIGMVAGTGAEPGLWRPLADWLAGGTA